MKPINRHGRLIPVCPHCRVEARLVVLPSWTPGMPARRRWECPIDGCDARVGVHRDSPRAAPLGTLARAPLRAARMRAHDAFDQLWRDYPPEFPSRKDAYAWLAGRLGIPYKRCHIGEFDEAMCQRVISEISSLMEAPR